MKIAELNLANDWQNLQELVEVQANDKIELYNAAVNSAEVFYTENNEVPTSATFFKILKAQTGVIITVGQQPIWVKAGYTAAKLMVSRVEG